MPAHASVHVAPCSRDCRTRCAQTASRVRRGKWRRSIRSRNSSSGMRRLGSPAKPRPSKDSGCGPVTSSVKHSRAVSNGDGWSPVRAWYA